MSGLAERLREIVRRPEGRPLSGIVGTDQSGDPIRPLGRPEEDLSIASVLDGRWAESHGHRYVVVDRCYGPGYRHGHVPLMDALPPWPRLPLLAGQGPGPRAQGPGPLESRAQGQASSGDGRLLFLDVETTGIGGGAGTYAFLVGCGWFDGGSFRVRQFFLSSYAAESAILDGLSDLARDTTAIVSFNGKSFDLPLIETRFLFHRRPTPFAGLPHIDMLHPARRLWRAREDAGQTASGCRLSALECALCGVARDGDVSGFEIPGRYFAYVRSGDVRPLAAVLEHNRLDLVSLAMLTARASQLLDEGPSGARTAQEALGLGRLYERGELDDLACDAYRRSAALSRDVPTRADALRSLAVLCRRGRRFGDAAGAWQQLLDLRPCPPHFAREAIEALAIHNEHRVRDLHTARQFALQSLRLEATLHSRQRWARSTKVVHRLARLERKLARPTTEPLRFS